MHATNPFSALIGEELNTVAFVMDYVEFHFNGPRVRALANPTVITADSELPFPSSGSRNALCQLIGQEVRDVVLREEHSLLFTFASGAQLRIPLDKTSYIGPEALHWHPDGDLSRMEIW